MFKGKLKGSWMMAGGAPNPQGSGLPVGKLLIGCGAVAMMGLIVIVVGVVGLGFVAQRSVEEYKDKAIETRERLEAMQQETARAREALEGAGEVLEQAGEMPSQSDLFTAIGQGGTVDDLRAHMKFMDAWAAHPDHKAQQEAQAKLTALADSGAEKPSLGDVAQAADVSRTMQVAAQSFEALSKPDGGIDAVFGRASQVIALVSAARHIDAAKPAAAATAAQMLAKQADVAAEYKRLLASRDRFLKLTANTADPTKLAELAQGDELKALAADQERLATLISQDPGFVMLAKLSAETLEAWAALSDEERDALMTRYDRLPNSPMLGLGFAANLDSKALAPLLAAMDQMQGGEQGQ
jgi:hypothetical protein